jgi:hypothetical protein
MLAKKVFQNEPELTYALDTSGKMVNIFCVERGLACNCFCPRCKKPLVAKLGNEGGRQPHFAHIKGAECHGAYMSALHKLSEQIIKEEMAVMAPSYRIIEAKKLLFTHVEVEQRKDRNDLQPDLVGISEDGQRWVVEIRNTHEIDRHKKEKIKESKITCLEVDVRNQRLENLKEFLLNSVESREWINNPNYDTSILEMKRKMISDIKNYIFHNRCLTLPSYNKHYDSKSISLKNISEEYTSDNGLFKRILIEDTEGNRYLLNIGFENTIKKAQDFLTAAKECSILNICVKDISSKSDFMQEDLQPTWVYHYLSKVEQKRNTDFLGNRNAYQTIQKSNNHSITKEQSAINKRNLDNYYKGLLKTLSYHPEGQDLSTIVDCYKSDRFCKIILLCRKENPKMYPYYISMVYVDEGIIKHESVAVFTNRREAKQRFNERLKYLL